uniref:Uncharacterized protein n=1 Tax=Anopheles coluzzii TaxID=1518534 RepID=A0A8W7PSI9_ANOCL
MVGFALATPLLGAPSGRGSERPNRLTFNLMATVGLLMLMFTFVAATIEDIKDDRRFISYNGKRHHHHLSVNVIYGRVQHRSGDPSVSGGRATGPHNCIPVQLPSPGFGTFPNTGLAWYRCPIAMYGRLCSVAGPELGRTREKEAP